MLSFAAVLYGDLSVGFVIAFIIILGVVQAIFQLAIWMHMKDRGHAFPILFIFMGFVTAMTAIIAALFWMWW